MAPPTHSGEEDTEAETLCQNSDVAISVLQTSRFQDVRGEGEYPSTKSVQGRVQRDMFGLLFRSTLFRLGCLSIDDCSAADNSFEPSLTAQGMDAIPQCSKLDQDRKGMIYIASGSQGTARNSIQILLPLFAKASKIVA